MLRDEIQGAREDFETCLELRNGARFGYLKDSRRIRTYGVHALNDYFPNRELGICLYFQNEPEAAARRLEQSLREAPSARAKYYLNMARRQLTASAALAPPQIEFDPATLGVWTRQRTRVISGLVKSPGFSRDVIVNGRPLFLELADSELKLAETVNLREGTNVVAVVVRDLTGRASTNTLTWIADWRAPQIAVQSIQQRAGAWRITGLAIDNEGLRSATMDGRQLPGSTIGGGQREIPFTLDLPAGGRALLLLEDMAGNQLQTPLSADELVRELASAPGPVFAQAGGDGVADVKTAGASSSSEVPMDRMKPRLALSIADDETAVVYHHEFFVTGESSDPGGLKFITINGEDQMTSGRGSRKVRFARMLPLEMGTNVFEVAAEDMSGNRLTRTFAVVRRQAEFLNQEYRLTVALPPLQPASMDNLALLAHGKIQHYITEKPARFQLVERNDGWQSVLLEQDISLSKIASKEVQLRIQKILPAELYLAGKLLPEGRGVTVQIDVLETGSTETLLVEDVYSEEPAANLDELSAGLVLKIKQRFPLLDGTVTGTSGGQVTVNVGQSQGVMPRFKFLVARKPADLTDPGAATLCRAGEIPVTLSVEQVARETSRAIVLPGEGIAVVRKGDLIYSR